MPLFVLAGIFVSGWLALFILVTAFFWILGTRLRGVPKSGMISEFEPVRQRLDDGWLLGAKPPNAG